jgi:two-component system, NtrC family, response regulator GlrR
MEPNYNETGDVAVRLIGRSEAFLRAVAMVERVTRTDATVLIRGETGTGKEVIARYIHYGGSRRARPFIPVNCGALPDALIENELFGHSRGAFTDARGDQPGLVRLAEGGTLFLDEIDSLTLRAQGAMLRFLEDRRFRPLGCGQELNSNVRVIAACNGPIEELCARGAFRHDLYYRIKLIELALPPLRMRTGDAAVLAEHFILECARRYSCARKRLHPESLRQLDRYDWPGNVRELENLVHSEFLMTEGDEILLRLPPDAGPAPPTEPARTVPPGMTHDGGSLPDYRLAKAEAVEKFDRAYLERVLAEAKGNVTSAARLAGKERRALGKLLKRYGIGDSYRAADEPGG